MNAEPLTQVIAAPFPLICGLLLLVVGPWLLRRAGNIVLIVLALASAASLIDWINGGVMLHVGGLWQAIIYLLAFLAALLAARHPVVAGNAELLFLLLICLFAGSELAAWLRWPLLAVWITLLLGGVFWRGLAIAVIAASLISCSLGVGESCVGLLVFLASLGVIALLQGWIGSGGYWDPSLNGPRPLAALRLRGLTQRSQRQLDSPGPLVFRSADATTQSQLLRVLKRHEIHYDTLPGGYAAAEIPTYLFNRWRLGSAARLIEIVPDYVYDGTRTLSVSPFVVSANTANAVHVDEVSKAVRTAHGELLQPDEATGVGSQVAILDTGVNAVTERLERSLVARHSFVPNEEPEDANGHGTMVGECVCAVAPQAKIYSLKAMDSSGSGTLLSFMLAMKWGWEHRDHITEINISAGSQICHGAEECPLCLATQELQSAGIVVVAAIGNDGPHSRTVNCPGASKGALGVGAVDFQSGRPAPFSSRGPCRTPSLNKPDGVCYGTNISLPGKDGAWNSASGTSFSSPLVAGVLAGIQEVHGVTPRAAKDVRRMYDIARRSCLPALDQDPNVVGRGIFNLASAVGEKIGHRRIRVRLPFPPPLRAVSAAAAAVLIAAALWYFGLDHVATRPAIPSRQLNLLGRVRALGDAPDRLIFFDDGTAVAPLRWTGDATTRPELGSVILLRARFDWDGPQSTPPTLEGLSRFQLGMSSTRRPKHD